MTNKDYIFIAVFFIFNLILKFAFIDNMSIAMDEPFSIYIAQMDLSSIVFHLSPGNNPPLFELILHFWIKFFGISPTAVRFLPFLFSSLTVIFVYLIGIRNFSRNIAILAAILFTFSNYQIYFSHEARVYSLFALLTTVSMFAFLELLKNSSDKKHFILLLITNSLLIYAHFFGFFVLIIQALCVLLFSGVRRKIFKTYLLVSIGVFILYLPYLKYFINRFFDSSTNGTWVQKPGWDAPYFMLWQFTNAPLTAIISIVVLLGALLLFIIKGRWTQLPDANKIIATWFIFPFFFMFFISFKVPMFMDRYVIHASIGLYLLLAISAVYLVNEAGKTSIAGLFPKALNFSSLAYLIALPIIFTCQPNVDNKRPVADVVRKVQELKDDKTAVVVCPDFFDLNFVYYYAPEFFRNYDDKTIKEKVYQSLANEHVYFINSFSQLDSNLLKTMDRVIFLDAAADYSYPDNQILDNLSKKKQLIEVVEIPEIFKVYNFNKVAN